MSRAHVQYLLVGAGLASNAAAEAIRARDRQGSVLMLGQENVRPYHRPPLSKQLLRREQSREEVFVNDVEWFVRNHVELRTGRRVAHLDVARRAVALDDGSDVSYEHMLLATGAAPKHLTIPGADLRNVYYLRTLADAEMLQFAIAKAKNEGRGRAAVVGGGVLGVEVAASLTQAGVGVDLIVGDPRPWKKFAGESVGALVTRFLESRRVTVHLNQRPLRLEGDGRVQRVLMADGSPIGCDFVVACIGSAVNRELLRGTPITAETAILADDHCRTNVQHVFAAGDCAAVFDPLFGKHRVIDHWDNARVTGTIAGTNMAGGDARYDGVNTFFSDVFDLSLRAWGESRQVDHRLVRGAGSSASGAGGETIDVVEIGVAADGRVAQVLALNHTGEDESLRELVARRVQIGGREEIVKDPAFPLSDLL